MKRVIFEEKIFKYPGLSAWYFVLVPKDVSSKIKQAQLKAVLPKRGWGSVPVCATTGTTSWQTSIFPDKKSGCFLLPIKKSVRLAEDVWDGDLVKIILKFN